MWSKWRDLTDTNLNIYWTDSPGVYFIRLINQKKRPIQIPRILDIDRKGILYIGLAKKRHNGGLCNRLWGFWTAITGKDETSHAAGKKYRHLIFKHFPNHCIQYRHRKVQDDRQAKKLEDKCLRLYQKQWGELPPLNRAGVE